MKNWSGKNKDIRLLRCRDCGKRFSERRGTIFFDSRLPKEKTISIMELIGANLGRNSRAHSNILREHKLCNERMLLN